MCEYISDSIATFKLGVCEYISDSMCILKISDSIASFKLGGSSSSFKLGDSISSFKLGIVSLVSNSLGAVTYLETMYLKISWYSYFKLKVEMYLLAKTVFCLVS